MFTKKKFLRALIPKAQKDCQSHQCLFALWGFAQAKAAKKLLEKSTRAFMCKIKQQ
jgi:hypothetical protein